MILKSSATLASAASVAALATNFALSPRSYFVNFNHQLENPLLHLSTIMAAVNNVLPGSLFALLSNDLILRHTSPYIGVKSLVSLAATSKVYKSLIYDTPQVFQHVNLYGTNVVMGSAWNISVHGERLGYLYAQRFSATLRMLVNRNVIQDVRTLVLDEAIVPIAILEDILCNERYQIHLLSLLRVYGLELRNVLQILRHLIRPSRPTGTPKLRGLYLFGLPSRIQVMHNFKEAINRSEAIGITTSKGAQLGAGNHMDHDPDDFRKLPAEDPYSGSPYRVMGAPYLLGGSLISLEWSEILEACAGLIAFDAVLCRHNRDGISDPRPRLATVRLPGCYSCGTCPEGPAYPGTSPADHLPLLSPPPLHSSKVEVAQRIDTNGQPYPPLILRCRYCLKDRWCESCNAWWCETCYTIPKNRARTKGDSSSNVSGPASNEEIKVHNRLCVSNCLMNQLLNGAGEGGMWG